MDCSFLPEIVEYCQQFDQFTSDPVFKDWGVLGLFLNSLLSATAIPLPTEILTSALLNGGESSFIVILVLVAGASVGGVLNYVIGFSGGKLFTKIRKTFRPQKKIKEFQPPEEHKWTKRLGWSGIFFSAFIPVVGDIILISAGVKRLGFKKFLLLMVAGNTVRSVVTVIGLGAIL